MKCGKVVMEKYSDHELEMALAYCAYNGVSLTWVKADGSTVKSKALWRSRAMLVFKQLQAKPNYEFTQGLSLSVRWTRQNEMVLSCKARVVRLEDCSPEFQKAMRAHLRAERLKELKKELGEDGFS